MRTILGVRAFRLGAQRDEGPRIALLESRVAAVRATAFVLPPVFRSAIVEEADGILAALADMARLAGAQTPNVATQARLSTRLAALPAEVDRLEANLGDAAEFAARIEAGEEIPPVTGGARPPAAPGGIAAVGLGLGVAAIAGLGVWLSV